MQAFKILTIFLFTFILLACGGGGGGGTSNNNAQTTPTNSAPVANAGSDVNSYRNITITLDGSASSDSNGDTLSHAWQILSLPQGSSASLENPTSVTPTITPDLIGTYSIELIVNDGTVSSTANTLTITIVNAEPVVNVDSEFYVTEGDSLTLDASASSDADNDALTFMWAVISSPATSNVTFDDSTLATPTITPQVLGEYILELVISDGVDTSEPKQISITVTEPMFTFSFVNMQGDENCSFSEISKDQYIQLNIGDEVYGLIPTGNRVEISKPYGTYSYQTVNYPGTIRESTTEFSLVVSESGIELLNEEGSEVRSHITSGVELPNNKQQFTRSGCGAFINNEALSEEFDVTSYPIYSTIDVDEDGIENSIDTDDDNDGVEDLFDYQPYDSSKSNMEITVYNINEDCDIEDDLTLDVFLNGGFVTTLTSNTNTYIPITRNDYQVQFYNHRTGEPINPPGSYRRFISNGAQTGINCTYSGATPLVSLISFVKYDAPQTLGQLPERFIQSNLYDSAGQKRYEITNSAIIKDDIHYSYSPSEISEKIAGVYTVVGTSPGNVTETFYIKSGIDSEHLMISMDNSYERFVSYYSYIKSGVQLPEHFLEHFWYRASHGGWSYVIYNEYIQTENTLFYYSSDDVIQLEDNFYQINADGKTFFIQGRDNPNILNFYQSAEKEEVEEVGRVLGHTIKHATYEGGEFYLTEDGNWVQTGIDGAITSTFTENGRDAWSVYLENDNGIVQIDIFLRSISHHPDGVGGEKIKIAETTGLYNSYVY